MSEESGDDTASMAPDAGGDVRDVLDLATDDGPLAAVVAESRTEIAIESLRAEGVYDDERAVRPYEGETVALPIERPPEETRVQAVVRQIDPDYRVRDLDRLLAERGWNEADRERAPGSWAVVGDVILVRIPPECPDEDGVADALLSLHGEAATVLADEGVRGQYRHPRTRHLAGETDTETVHVEHGTRYALDPSEVMFSPGNQAERVRMGEIVDPDAHVLDMFAGIGYFTLPMARAGARVTATELNPTAFRYLLENAVANDVADRIDAYNADCRDVAPELSVDRAIMGYYGTSDRERDGNTGRDDADKADDGPGRTGEAREFLPAALRALDPGGTLHYHEACPEPQLWDRPIDRLESATAAAGRSLDGIDRRRVKTHSAGVVHVVLDATVR